MLTKRAVGLALAGALAITGMSVGAAKADPFHRYGYHYYYEDGYGFNPVGAAIGTAAGIVGGATAVATGYPYGPYDDYGPYPGPYAYNYGPHAYGYYGPDYEW